VHDLDKNITGITGISYSKLNSTFANTDKLWNSTKKSHIENSRISPVLTFERLQLILNNTSSHFERSPQKKRTKSSIT